MNEWQHFEPTGGWVCFTESDTLTEALWAELPRVDWHYMNFTSDSSIWSSRQDASAVVLHYEKGRLVELVVQLGVASDILQSVITRFRLVPVLSPN
jgi:hypothetical protein